MLSDHERRVLAELEADLDDVRIEPRRWMSVARAVAGIIPLAAVAAVLAVAAVSTLPSAVSAALTGVIGTVAASAATAVVMSKRVRHLPCRHRRRKET